MKYHVDGDLVSADEASVSVRDRGFRYGDAAFETLRSYNRSIFEWDAHEARLRRTAEQLGFADAVPNDLRERVRATLAANDCDEAYVRLSVTRGAGAGRLTPPPDIDPTVVIIVEELPRGGLSGESVWDGPATVQTVKTRAVPDAAVPSDAKTHNYLNGILARLELQRAANEEYRADEALLRDDEGHLMEGATSNVFFVDDGTLKTPSTDGPLLDGITRSVVLDLAADEEFPVETGRYTTTDVREADEAFLTNTTWELRPIARADGVAVGGGPVTRLLARLFDERVERRQYE
ncbi:aminotransferase class IV [Halococcus saccharolyticus]|uniref:Branched-chain amino acid aminotransferase n=1 Tax=Halococcus saccharolyticus DSM 5350 TaxID=1227455 RepID=M0MGT9_9EURY|nr:aminotransferase class IV [Halococcus saccharolyticus]EMA44931.1 branched-chain amino acid aminotransferase [Halococcus saccharolyticus DSM 5350]